MSALDNVLTNQKRSQFGTGTNASTNQGSGPVLNSEAAERRHGAVKNGMRVMNQASSIGSFQNRAGGMGGAKYPSRQEIESF